MKSRMLWLGIFLSLSLAAWGQDSASITGTVTDPSGAAVANARVTLSNPEHGINRETDTNGDGQYLVSGVPPGLYKLTFAAPGFKKYEAAGLILRVAQKARADAELQVGAATSEVTVEGTPVAAVETQTNELAGTVTGKEISQLQLNRRVFTQLITLTPGVSNQTGSSEGQYGITANTNYSVNGGRLEYNNWELDGGDNMDNGSNATLNVTPSIDAIAEVRVLTSNYGAQYGRNASGTIETETKSGTSAFHGNAYEFVRNDIFNAAPHFQPEVPSYKKTTGAIPSVVRFTFRAFTTRTKTKLSSSGLRSGAGTGFRVRTSIRSCRQWQNEAGTSPMFVPARTVRLILVREIRSMEA